MNRYALMRKLSIQVRRRLEISHILTSRWKLERKYRFTVPQFYLISHRQRNHDKLAQDIMCLKTFRSRLTDPGIKSEPLTIDRYHKYMHSRKTPVHVLTLSKVNLLYTLILQFWDALLTER